MNTYINSSSPALTVLHYIWTLYTWEAPLLHLYGNVEFLEVKRELHPCDTYFYPFMELESFFFLKWLLIAFSAPFTTAVSYHTIKEEFPSDRFILRWGHLNFQTLNRNHIVKGMSLAQTRPSWDLILWGHSLPSGWRRWPLLPFSEPPLAWGTCG